MKFETILFDCDGVLVDSEPSNGVLCTMLNEAGWAISAQDCMEIFIGKTVRSEAARIQKRTRPAAHRRLDGPVLRPPQMPDCKARLQAIAGAVDAVRRARAARQPHRLRLGQTGERWRCTTRPRWAWPATLATAFSAATKCPASPRLMYLAAAAAEGRPARCLVVEDTVTGVTAGVAAGATVVGYSPSSVGHSSPEALRAAAVRVIADMALLPALLA